MKCHEICIDLNENHEILYYKIICFKIEIFELKYVILLEYGVVCNISILFFKGQKIVGSPFSIFIIRQNVCIIEAFKHKNAYNVNFLLYLV